MRSQNLLYAREFACLFRGSFLSFLKKDRATQPYFSFHKISSRFESKQALHLYTKNIKTYNHEPTKVDNEPTKVTEATTKGITQNGKRTPILPDVP
jgi:hypothetical protein